MAFREVEMHGSYWIFTCWNKCLFFVVGELKILLIGGGFWCILVQYIFDVFDKDVNVDHLLDYPT